jgi:predicted RNA-binding Zn-ribbon protein involved in translation (DUF1610 family)
MNREICVILECTQDLIFEKDVEFVDVTCDETGRDQLVFTCPECGEVHVSYRYGWYSKNI